MTEQQSNDKRDGELVAMKFRLTELLRKECDALEAARAHSAAEGAHAEIAALIQEAERIRGERAALAEEIRRRDFAAR